MRFFALLPLIAALACTPSAGPAGGAAGDPDEWASRSTAPPQPAVQPANRLDNPEAGFDIRLPRVQPGVHLDTVQPCDIVFSGRPEAVEEARSEMYPVPATYRMAIKCAAPSGEGWADLLFPPGREDAVGDVRRGRRIRLRIHAADGGYFDYPIVSLEAVEGDNPALAQVAPRVGPVSLANGFNVGSLAEEPALVGTAQRCSVAFAAEIDLVRPNDRRRRSYPAGVQNRMTVRCKHSRGEEPADLLFMPGQALAALEVRRGAVVDVRVIARNGGYVDYPILQYAGQ